jgi:hypothetical protein
MRKLLKISKTLPKSKEKNAKLLKYYSCFVSYEKLTTTDCGTLKKKMRFSPFHSFEAYTMEILNH